jgi:hypothetical protein
MEDCHMTLGMPDSAAYSYPAACSGGSQAMVLVGCRIFDRAARDQTRFNLEERTDDNSRRRMEHLPGELPDFGDQLCVLGKLIKQLDL